MKPFSIIIEYTLCTAALGISSKHHFKAFAINSCRHALPSCLQNSKVTQAISSGLTLGGQEISFHREQAHLYL